MNEARRIRLEDDTNEKKKKRKEDYLLKSNLVARTGWRDFFRGEGIF